VKERQEKLGDQAEVSCQCAGDPACVFDLSW